MLVEPDTILFGEKGADDWAFAPDVIARLDDSPGYMLLEEEDQDEDPTEATSDWPVISGSQIIWIQDASGDEAEPMAIVSADRAGRQETLEEAAQEWARGSEGVEINITASGEVQVIYENPED